MKNKLILLSLLFLFLLDYSVLCQDTPVIPLDSVPDNTENLTSDDLKKMPKSVYQSDFRIENFLEPNLSVINFDDIIVNQNNSITISPNRYANVSFYSPYANNNTYLTYIMSYSNPNSLYVGYPVYNPQYDRYDIYTNDRLVVEFTHPSKDVSFLWGSPYYGYNVAWLDIYEANNQLVTTLTVNFVGEWIIMPSLNQYSERIKKLVLRRPTNVNSLYGRIHLDNFQFTPVPSYSPIGTLESVSIQNGAAIGWSADPDSQSASNVVHCYVDGFNPSNFIGAANANLPGAGAPYPGNHRFSLPIPIQYRDGNNHQITCFGLDVTGGDSPGTLAGSPKTFKFNAPVGTFESINADGEAIGWSLDPDNQAQPNLVHFYVNGPAGGGGTYIGEAIANLPHPITGYTGNHGFKFSIPAQYRDNQPHPLYAYGLDLTGDNSKPLAGNPKTFNLMPVVQTTVFEELPASPLSNNPNAGGGKRIFYDKRTPTDTVDRSIVKVKVTLSAPTQGVNVYVKDFDIDEPSTDSLPIDKNGSSSGSDNRGYGASIYCSVSPSNTPCSITSNGMSYATTNTNGEAFFYFSINYANPGDNYAVATSTKESDLLQILVTGLDIQNYQTNRIFQIGTDRTEMLTGWRKLHIEVDSMGVVQRNYNGTSTQNEVTVGASDVPILLQNTIDSKRFQNGRMILGTNSLLNIRSNNSNSVTVYNPNGTATVLPYYLYRLYDDDDYNNDNLTNGFDADNGEDIAALSDSFDLLQENDDTNCSDGTCNVFAAAYIQPEFAWANPYNTSNIQYVQNVDYDFDVITAQINQGRNSDMDESEAFWVVYIQIDYQSGIDQDNDRNEETGVGGATPKLFGDTINDVSSVEGVPKGSQGSLVFMEAMQDLDKEYGIGTYKIKTFPHEIGHQLGLNGDGSDPNMDLGLMDYGSGLSFVDRHLNIIRWRRKSPGVQPN